MLKLTWADFEGSYVYQSSLNDDGSPHGTKKNTKILCRSSKQLLFIFCLGSAADFQHTVLAKERPRLLKARVFAGGKPSYMADICRSRRRSHVEAPKSIFAALRDHLVAFVLRPCNDPCTLLASTEGYRQISVFLVA